MFRFRASPLLGFGIQLRWGSGRTNCITNGCTRTPLHYPHALVAGGRCFRWTPVVAGSGAGEPRRCTKPLRGGLTLAIPPSVDDLAL